MNTCRRRASCCPAAWSPAAVDGGGDDTAPRGVAEGVNRARRVAAAAPRSAHSLLQPAPAAGCVSSAVAPARRETASATEARPSWPTPLSLPQHARGASTHKKVCACSRQQNARSQRAQPRVTALTMRGHRARKWARHRLASLPRLLMTTPSGHAGWNRPCAAHRQRGKQTHTGPPPAPAVTQPRSPPSQPAAVARRR